MENTLYYGDNLKILREHIPDESVDLIYLDPPFNSKTDYNILFKEKTGESSEAQIIAFKDTWQWGESESAFYEIVQKAPASVVEMMTALRQFIGENSMMAYLTMMCIRLIALKRVLKHTGSIYLHCDPTASHYLKIVMDTIFGIKNFRNEIIWHYKKWTSGNKQFQRNHDSILFYSKSDSQNRIFNQIDLMERAESTKKRFGEKKIISGYDENGKRIPSQTTEEESLGVPRDTVWDIKRVPPIKQLFPTQKPELLISRIIRASSHENCVVLDPFCGCGTTIVEANNHNRKWIGIDITHLAFFLIKWRLKDIFKLEAKKDYGVIGEPEDLASAQDLFHLNPYQFQWWACSLVDARPFGDKKKGADRGIDGYIYFNDEDDSGKITKKAIVQVKGGKVGSKPNVSQIRDLCHVIDREKAEIGIFICLQEPTKPMIVEAVSKGFYHSLQFNKDYPKLQILTIKELFQGKVPQIPLVITPHKQAERTIKDNVQPDLLDDE